MEILSNKGKGYFIIKIINLKIIGKTSKVTINGYTARLKTSNSNKLVELISNNYTQAKTVDNETMQDCALRVKGRRPKLYVNVHPKLSELFWMIRMILMSPHSLSQ